MAGLRTRVHTGGCRCGTARYSLLAEPFDPHICHYRMCQKAFGSRSGPLAVIGVVDFGWTWSRPATFNSSSMVPPVEVGKGGVELLADNGLLKQHQVNDRHAVGEARLAVLEQWAGGRDARSMDQG